MIARFFLYLLLASSLCSAQSFISVSTEDEPSSFLTDVDSTVGPDGALWTVSIRWLGVNPNLGYRSRIIRQSGDEILSEAILRPESNLSRLLNQASAECGIGSGGNTVWAFDHSIDLNQMPSTVVQQIFSGADFALLNVPGHASSIVVSPEGEPIVFVEQDMTGLVGYTRAGSVLSVSSVLAKSPGFDFTVDDVEAKWFDGHFCAAIALKDVSRTEQPGVVLSEIHYVTGRIGENNQLELLTSEVVTSNGVTGFIGVPPNYGPDIDLDVDEFGNPGIVFNDGFNSSTQVRRRGENGWLSTLVTQVSSGRPVGIAALGSGRWQVAYIDNNVRIRIATSSSPTAFFQAGEVLINAGSISPQQMDLTAIGNGLAVPTHSLNNGLATGVVHWVPEDSLDSDGDGQIRLIEEALGTSDSDSEEKGETAFELTGRGNSRLAQFEFTRPELGMGENPSESEGIVYTVEWSTDLVTWNAGPMDFSTSERFVPGRGVVFTALRSVGQSAQQYFRLRIYRGQL